MQLICDLMKNMRQVKYVEAVNAMVLQLLHRLCRAESHAQTARHFVVCVTSDHSTPVLRGDHSHEPVPFAIAHVEYVPTYAAVELI